MPSERISPNRDRLRGWRHLGHLLTFSAFGSGRTAAPALALGIGLIATAGLLRALPHPDTSETFAAGLLAFLVLQAVAGVVNALGFDVFAEWRMGRRVVRRRRWQTGRAVDSLTRLWIILGATVAAHLLLGGITAIALALGGQDAAVFEQVLLGSLASACAHLLGVLAGLMVVWPVSFLVLSAVHPASRGRLDPIAVPFSVLLIGTVVLGIVAVPGQIRESPPGTPAGQGLYQVLDLILRFDGTPEQQAWRWAARATLFLLALVLVWLVLGGRAARRGDTAAWQSSGGSTRALPPAIEGLTNLSPTQRHGLGSAATTLDPVVLVGAPRTVERAASAVAQAMGMPLCRREARDAGADPAAPADHVVLIAEGDALYGPRAAELRPGVESLIATHPGKVIVGTGRSPGGWPVGADHHRIKPSRRRLRAS